jgi:elongation factor P--beta-lysine ligase
VDTDHNPEFTTCEVYQAYAGLEDMLTMTETLISMLAQYSEEKLKKYETLKARTIDCTPPFRRLDFIPELERAIDRKLPDLTSPDAEWELVQIYHKLDISLPDLPNLPRMLNHLSSIYLEPQCIAPTFILHYPECMSPLSRSFVDPKSHQRVAARAELFIEGREIVNTYEEENSPPEQKRKFIEQSRYRGKGEASMIDEDYLQALEWGLPPTAGWGCGIERLCMAMLGASRIADVLSFGSIRNVVGLGPSLPNSDANGVSHFTPDKGGSGPILSNPEAKDLFSHRTPDKKTLESSISHSDAKDVFPHNTQDKKELGSSLSNSDANEVFPHLTPDKKTLESSISHSDAKDVFPHNTQDKKTLESSISHSDAKDVFPHNTQDKKELGSSLSNSDANDVFSHLTPDKKTLESSISHSDAKDIFPHNTQDKKELGSSLSNSDANDVFPHLTSDKKTLESSISHSDAKDVFPHNTQDKKELGSSLSNSDANDVFPNLTPDKKTLESNLPNSNANDVVS